MKFSVMRRLDLYMGYLLCHLLSFIYKIGGIKKRKKAASEPVDIKKVLVIKFLGFGSTIMTIPFMREIKKNYPQCEVHFLTFSDNVQICESIRLIDRTVYLDKKSLWKFILTLVKTLYQIRRQNYDIAFNLEFFSNFSLLLAALSKSKLTICFGGRHEYRKTLSQKIVSYENEVHIIDKFCNFLKILKIIPTPESKPLMELNENPEAKRSISDILKKRKVDISKDFLVIVNINSGEMSRIRMWPPEYYQQVISFLLGKKEIRIILVGGKEDVSYVSHLERKIVEGRDRVINLSGLISLKELISLMKVGNLYLGNDSGPLHLAEACGLPNVSFFGPESPKVYGHSGDKNYIFYSNLPCSPCLNVYTNKDTRCNDNICLKMIGPEDVIKVLEEKYFKEP